LRAGQSPCWNAPPELRGAQPENPVARLPDAPSFYIFRRSGFRLARILKDTALNLREGTDR
jgi:hypothetical protein